MAYERGWALSPDTPPVDFGCLFPKSSSSSPSLARYGSRRGQESGFVTSENVGSSAPPSQNRRVKALWGPRIGPGGIERTFGRRAALHCQALTFHSPLLCSPQITASSGQDTASLRGLPPGSASTPSPAKIIKSMDTLLRGSPRRTVVFTL